MKDSRALALGVAFVWLATGVLVLSPLYRAVGDTYLARLGLPSSLMWATCAFEVVLAFRVALGPPNLMVTVLQLGLVLGFSVILGVFEPRLLVSPFGMLTKNVPIMAAVAGAFLLEREGWTRRVTWLLRVGMAFVWLSEGLLPKILFQQPEELVIAAGSGLAFGHPSALLRVIGALQLASGLLALGARGRLLRFVLGAQVAGLVIMPALVSLQVPWLWLHPFGPYTKNVPVLVGTYLLFRRCSSWS